jgi:hypothetical protein
VIRSAAEMRASSAVRRPGRAATLLFVVPAALGLAAWLILAGHRLFAGLAASVAAVGSLALTVEGSGRLEPRIVFATRVLDRAFEAALLAPLAWAAREGSMRRAILAMVGLGASYLASYERARGEALGYREREGAGYRFARWALLVFGLLTGWLEPSLWAFAVLTLAASAVRAANVARQERRDGLAAEGPLA